MITQVTKASHAEAMKFMIPVLRELDRLAIDYRVNEQKKRIIINIPRFIPAKEAHENQTP